MYTFRDYHIPVRMLNSINRYIHKGIQPGDFLTAVICNNLSDAVGYADDSNLHNLPAFVGYFYNEAPANCWGSKKIMEKWIRKKKNKIRVTPFWEM